MKRREALVALAGAGGAALLASDGCARVEQQYVKARTVSPDALAPPHGPTDPALRLLNRAAFGPAPGDVAEVTRQGADAWVETQLAVPTDDSDETLGLRLRLHGIEVLKASPYDLRDLPENEVLRQLQQAAILRAVYSKWQLRERMVDFWGDHFNIYARKRYGTYLKGSDDLHVVRSHALGSFPDMLRASARSPAMMGYLDNQQNRVGVANENYAREIMELHTLGVGGGYTQKDVQEVARCLTGWTVEERFLHRRGTFRFDPAAHDDGPKTVLGQTFSAGGGEGDGERVLSLLAHHPSTARFIAGKLVRHFVGHDDALTAQVAAMYTQTGGDIAALMRVILRAPALHTAPPLIKRPFDFMASALRATNADTDGGAGVQTHLAAMGQPLYQWPMPDGYPDKTASWTGSLLHRWNFAVALAGNGIKGTSVSLPPGTDPAALASALLARPVGDASLRSLDDAMSGLTVSSEVAALALASPIFQWR